MSQHRGGRRAAVRKDSPIPLGVSYETNRRGRRIGPAPTPRNYGPDYKRRELLAAGDTFRNFGDDYAAQERKLFGLDVEDPADPPKPPTPPTRDRQAPVDPYETGATGTITGLTGGSLAAPYTDADFVGMLGEKYGIELTNPFAGAPNPATPGHQSQIRLENGEIDARFQPGGAYAPSSEAIQDLKDQNSPFALGVDANPVQDQKAASGLEALRTLSPDDVHIPEGELSEADKKYATSRRSDRSRAFLDYDGPGGSMAALRAAEASQGYFYDRGKYKMTNEEGGFSEVTREGIQQYKEGQIGAEDLLSKHLAQAPEKALNNAIAAGNADLIDTGNMDSETAGAVYDAANNFEAANADELDITTKDGENMFGQTALNYLKRLGK